MLDAIRSGAWLDDTRVRRIALLSGGVTISALAYLFLTANGTLDYSNRPLGTDFSNVWTAGAMALDGRAPLAWDWASHFAVQQATHHKMDVDFYGWHYPPPFLLVAALLATLPYLWALFIYQVVTLSLALATLRTIDHGRSTLIAGLGAPVVMTCLTHGHNGFLTAALFGGGLVLLERKPFIAGFLLGCMIYKPQFGLVVPVVLLFGGNLRAIGGAVASALVLSTLTVVIWGLPVWEAFFHSLALTQSVVIEQGGAGWYKIQSVFSAIRNWGGSVAFAWGAQALATLVAICGAALIARGVDWKVKGAGVIAATLLSTPYVLDYDLVPLALAIAMLVSDGRNRGFLSWEKTLFAFAWISPLIGRAVMAQTSIPIGCLSIVTIFVVSLRRAWHFDRGKIFTAWPFPRLRESFAR